MESRFSPLDTKVHWSRDDDRLLLEVECKSRSWKEIHIEFNNRAGRKRTRNALVLRFSKLRKQMELDGKQVNRISSRRNIGSHSRHSCNLGEVKISKSQGSSTMTNDRDPLPVLEGRVITKSKASQLEEVCSTASYASIQMAKDSLSGHGTSCEPDSQDNPTMYEYPSQMIRRFKNHDSQI